MALKDDEPPTLEFLKKQFGLELYEASGIMGVRPPTSEELIERANNWFSEHDKKIRDLLSSDKRIRELAYGSKVRDQRAIAALILDALSSSLTGFPLATAATIIANYYLDHYIDSKTSKNK